MPLEPGDLPTPSQAEITDSQLPPPTIMTYQEFDATLRSAPKQFLPTTERIFPQKVGRNFVETQALDLSRLPNESVVEIAGGAHPEAHYIIEVIDSPEGKKIIYIWWGGHCVKGLAEGIISHNEPVDGKYAVRKGVLQVGDGMTFPYFRTREGKLLPPMGGWTDTCAFLKFSTKSPQTP